MVFYCVMCYIWNLIHIYIIYVRVRVSTTHSVELRFFRRYVAPTQWAVRDCSPLKESPGRGPPLGGKFSDVLVIFFVF